MADSQCLAYDVMRRSGEGRVASRINGMEAGSSQWTRAARFGEWEKMCGKRCRLLEL